MHKIKSQKGLYHVYSNGYTYRRDKNGLRCTDCNSARGNIVGKQFTQTGFHNHKPNYKKIKSKIISNCFVSISTEYMVRKNELKKLYKQFFEQNVQYSEYSGGFSAVWLRTLRNLKKNSNKRKTYDKNKIEKEINELLLTLEIVSNNEKTENMVNSPDSIDSGISSPISTSDSLYSNALSNEFEVTQSNLQTTNTFDDASQKILRVIIVDGEKKYLIEIDLSNEDEIGKYEYVLDLNALNESSIDNSRNAPSDTQLSTNNAQAISMPLMENYDSQKSPSEDIPKDLLDIDLELLKDLLN